MSHLRALLLALALLASGCVASTTSPFPASAPSVPPADVAGHTAPPASARDEPPPLLHRQHIEATAHDPGFFAFDTAHCASGTTSCAAYASGIAYFHGDMEGTYAYHLVAEPQPDGTLRAHDDGWYVGSIKGCGSGAVAGQFWLNVSASQVDPGARALVAKATLVLNGATATEGLRGISGLIPNVFSISNPVTKENDMVFSGDITCAALHERSAAREVHVEADLRDPGLDRFDSMTCPAPGPCRFKASGVAYFSGNIRGSYQYHAWAEPQPNGSMVLGDDGWMVATVDGCGPGAFGMRLVAHSTGPAFDPVRGARLATMTIVPGTGTGPLAGISGSITGVNSFSQDASTKGSVGHLSGVVRCDGPQDPPVAPSAPVHVEMDLDDPGLMWVDALQCGSSSCHASTRGIAYLSGNVRGTYSYHAFGDPSASSTIPLGDDGWLVLDIDGCGAGAVGMHYAGTVAAPGAFGPQGVELHGNFTVMPGTGTGALAGMTGVISGTNWFRDLVTRANDGHFSGELVCRAT